MQEKHDLGLQFLGGPCDYGGGWIGSDDASWGGGAGFMILAVGGCARDFWEEGLVDAQF